jgi:tetratricopeptide (TPR) repeat protein
MGLVEKYRWGNNNNIPASNIEIDSLSTLDSIKKRQGWMIAAQIATVVAIADQTKKTTDALRLVNDTLLCIEDTIQNGFDSLETSIERLESNLIENLSEIKWYLFNVDKKLDQLINLVKFSGATKSAEYNKQGFILYKIGSFKEAIGQLEKSLAENPLNIEAYINLGFVHLRLENLRDSIKNFELASKIIKEDFSYYEEISSEQLKKTEVFILDNLSNLYSMQDQIHQSIELMNKILSKDIDKKTEILTNYKLAKYKCIIKEYDDALEIINKLINNQYFEPVALAVANPEFKEISSRILEILQFKLEEVKKKFSEEAKNKFDKINLFDVDSKFKADLIISVEKTSIAIKQSSNFSILLTSKFKESYNDFLQYIHLLGELKLKTERELLSSSHDLKKLEIISEINNKIDTNYDNSSDVVQISHKILLSKVKLNVKAGINKKVGSFNNAQNIFNNADLLLNKGLKTIISLSSDEIIEYINSKFDLSDLSMRLLPELTSKEEEKITSDKIINDYSTIISKYDLKKSIDFGSIDNLSNEDGEFTNVFNVSERDPLFEEAARMIVLHQQGSTSLIQRKLKLGYNRAGRIIDQLEAAHIVGPFDGSKAREVLITDEYSLDKFMSGLDT